MTKGVNGRPAGSIDPVIAGKAFGMDEFVAVRAYLKGIDPLTACKQYLMAEEVPRSTQAALRRIEDLISRIAVMTMSRRLGEGSETDGANLAASAALKAAADACKDKMRQYQRARAEAANKLAERLEQEARALKLMVLPPLRNRPPLPSYLVDIKEFEIHYDRKMRPDYDLDAIELKAALEDFKADYWRELGFYYRPDHSDSYHEHSEGTANSAYSTEKAEREHSRIDAKVAAAAARAMEIATWTVQRRPNAADTLGSWFVGSSLKRLGEADIFTLYSLCDVIRRRGLNWWKDVPGLGPVRAQRIQNWLREVKVEGFEINDNMFEPVQRRRLIEKLVNDMERPALPSLAQFGLEPLSPFINNTRLNGVEGIFRRREPNMLKAETDIDAILVALGKYADKKNTLKLYAREICRFCLWAYRERQMPVSSLGIDDVRLYREFLGEIPADWISDTSDAAPRGSSEWRPFRGQLDQSSQRIALTAVSVVMRQLLEAGYLSGNPVAGVLKHAELLRPKIDASRSFNVAQWNFICTMLEEEETTAFEALESGALRGEVKVASVRRLKALLHTLYSTGMRRDELFKARLGHIRSMVVDGQTSHLLEVVGKRSKVRSVVLHPHILKLIYAHLEDRPPLFNKNINSKDVRDKTPLISVLQAPVSSHAIEDDGRPILLSRAGEKVKVRQREMASEDGALGVGGMASTLKRFLSKCTREAPRCGHDPEAFEKATLHWMRHTFGHSMTDAGVDIRVTQKLMGHVNINTTAIYSKADDEQMVRGARVGAAAMLATRAQPLESPNITTLPSGD